MLWQRYKKLQDQALVSLKRKPCHTFFVLKFHPRGQFPLCSQKSVTVFISSDPAIQFIGIYPRKVTIISYK